MQLREWLLSVLHMETVRYEECMNSGQLSEALRLAGRIEAYREVRCMLDRGYEKAEWELRVSE